MTEIKSNEWMKSLDGNLPITSLSIPGTHDSGTKFCTYKNASQCQDTSIIQQLQNGYRFLDIRLCMTGETMIVVHARANCFTGKEKKTKLTLDKALHQCYEFLEHNPFETIFMSIKKDRGFGGNEFARILLEKYFKRKMGRWFLENRNPKLNEVRGKIVLIRRYKIRKSPCFSDNNSGINLSEWPDQKSKKDFQGKIFSATRLDKKESRVTAKVQDRYMFAPEIKWKECVLPVLKTNIEKETFGINFLSTAYKLSPKENASVVNKYFRRFETEKGKNYGIVVVDFADKEIARKIFLANKFIK